MLRAPMALDDKELQKLRAHYAKHAQSGAEKCPVCGSGKWSVDGPVALPSYLGFFDAVDTNRSVAVVLLVCTTCYYVRQFAWRPINGESDG